MSDVVSSLVAVLGTLAGSAMTYMFAERSRRSDRREAHREASRHERLDAYSNFYSALADYRRAQWDRWHYRTSESYERASALEQRQALEAVYRQRVAIHAAMARVRLTARPSVDDAVVNAAQVAFDKVDEMVGAENEADIERRGDLARDEASAFLTIAASSVYESK